MASLPESGPQLLDAIGQADAAAVARLLAAGADPNTRTPDGDQTALELACLQDSVEVVRLLLDAGARVDETNRFNHHTALVVAAAQGRIEVMQRLIAGGADVHHRLDLRWDGDKGNTALTHILDSEEVQHPSLAAVATLLAAGASPDQRTASGWPALLFAAERGDPALVEALLDAGADIQATRAGFYAIDVADSQGHADVVQRLLARGSRRADLR